MKPIVRNCSQGLVVAGAALRCGRCCMNDWHGGNWREMACWAIFPNSYFVLAGQSTSNLLLDSWMGDIYATNRSPGLEVRTRVTRDVDGSISTQKSYMGVPPDMAAFHFFIALKNLNG